MSCNLDMLKFDMIVKLIDSFCSLNERKILILVFRSAVLPKRVSRQNFAECLVVHVGFSIFHSQPLDRIISNVTEIADLSAHLICIQLVVIKDYDSALDAVT